LLFLAIVAKSAMGVYSRWLPIAMEGPTPVSSLLHSSTMVLAGVYLLRVIGNGGYIVILRAITLFVGFGSVIYDDIKKRIALSTSANLGIICILVRQGIYRLCMIHMITHAMVKMSMFIGSRVNIHCSGNQSLYRNFVPVNLLGFRTLCGVRCLIVSKENSLRRLFRIVFLVISWNYTKRSSMGMCNNV
jgi:NADH:ubiquinone oxidoreductase subunit 5 (subunit L)/multisubunit Na+/H+ antiporter MnhA subunit